MKRNPFVADSTAASDTDTSDREIISTRLIDAPREKVFRAWTDPEHLARWWGPNGFTNTFHAYDLRPGGAWSFIMHGPDGKDYKNESVFVEIVRPERIVLDHVNGPKYHMIATFDDVDGKTWIRWRMIFESVRDYEWARPICVNANEENFDRLEAELARMA